MKRVWLKGILLGVSLTLLMASVAAARSLARPEITTPPEPPKGVKGLYFTSEDNEDKDGTGTADGDMGYAAPDYVCTDDPRAPVEFNIVVGEEVCSDGVLTLQGFLWEGGDVYFNGDLLGTIPTLFIEEWSAQTFNVPLASLEEGANLVEIVHGEWACTVLAWATLEVEPCAEEFVPEPGSLLLLGSGLAGLAGYASLRWRTKE